MKPLFPPEVLAQHTAILGKTGSGKTSTAKLAIEQVVAGGSRVCILDPIKSDWWGLTSSADGKKPGLPFHILGGPHGHVPLHASAGKAIGEVVATGALPLSIIDMADFEPGGQSRFFIEFAPVLMRKMRGVLYLVIEEAHLFAPKERSGMGAENMAIHWAKTLATAGRTKGIRLIVLTQRTQALHNAVLGSCDSMVVHRITAPADQEPVVKWLRANMDAETRAQVETSLSGIRTGSAWLCSGEAKLHELVNFPRIKTYDNTATPTEGGKELTVKTAPVDAEKLRAIVGEAVKEAEANDPKLLKKRIAELEREKATQKPQPVAKPEVDQKALDTAYKKGLLDGRASVVPKLNVICRQMSDLLSEIPKLDVMPGIGPVRESPARVVTAPAPRAPSDTPASIGQGGLRRILTALAQRTGGLTARQIGVRATMSSKSGSFRTYLSTARKEGWIEGSGTIRITSAGIDSLGDYTPLPTGSALLEFWIGELGNSGASRILRAVSSVYPNSLSNEECAEQTEMSGKSGSFRTYLAKLRSLELIEGRGDLKASAELFD